MMAARRVAADDAWRHSAVFLAILLVTGLLLLWQPIGLVGGPTDDGRYLEAARAWAMHPPFVGTRHWDLREPLVLPLAAWLRMFGDSLVPFRLIPALYYLGFVAAMLVLLNRLCGWRATLVWAVLLCSSPLLHDLGTRAYPEIVELFYIAASLAALAFAVERNSRSLALLSGLALSLAMLTRETSWWLVLVYGVVLLAGRPVPRATMLWVVAGALPLFLLDELRLWWATGDPLYRIHVDLHHVRIGTLANLGGVPYRGDHVLMNPDLARRWHGPGSVRVNWIVNPLINLFTLPAFGATFWLAGLARRGQIDRPARRLLMTVALFGTVAFVLVTYVLVLSQAVRLYAVPLVCASVAAAVLIDRLLLKQGRIKMAIALVAVHVLVFVLIIDIRHNDSLMQRLAVGLVDNIHEPIHTLPDDVWRLEYRYIAAGRPSPFVDTPTPIGQLRLYQPPSRADKRAAGDPDPPCCWRVERRLSQPEPLTRRLAYALGLKRDHGDVRRSRIALELRRRIG